MSNKGKTMGAVAAYFALFVLTQVATQFVAITAIAMKFTQENPAGDLEKFIVAFAAKNVINIVLLSTISTFVILFIISRVKKMHFMEFVGAREKAPRTIMIMCFVAGVCANIWLAIVMQWLPIPAEIMQGYQSATAPIVDGNSIFAIVTVVLLAPILEEIIFRGLILPRLLSVSTAGVAILFQGILFGIMHGNIVWVVYAALFGSILGYITLCTGTVRTAAVFHIAFNCGNIVLNLILETFGQSQDVLLLIMGISSVLFIFSIQKIAQYNAI